MDIEAFRNYLQASRSAYAKWGAFVVSTLEQTLKDYGISVEEFIKIPVKPRIKTIDSAVGKLGRKGYADPLSEMTDLVGVRFVVLLSDDIDIICKAIENEASWTSKVSRDFAMEIEKNTKIFDYQSQHFEIRPKQPMELDGLTVDINMCCEIQVRTLLQHAYAEMVHDNMYKPSGFVPPKAERHVARSMALMETTDDLFCRTMVLLKEANAPKIALLNGLTELYSQQIGRQYLAQDDKSASVLADEFREFITGSLTSDIAEFLSKKKYISMNIAKRADFAPMFNQSAVLFVYWLALNHDTDSLIKRWPLPGYWNTLNTILSDVDRRPNH